MTLIGRVTRKPEGRDIPSGQKLATFSLATNYVWRDFKSKERKDKTEFHRVVVWGKLAEIGLTYLDKGSRIYGEGRLQHRAWQDAKGQKRTSTDIIADEIIMLSPHSSDEPTKEEPSENDLVVEEV